MFISTEVKALLIGQGVEQKEREAMLEFLNAQPALEKVFNLLTYQLGPDVMVAIKAKIHTQGSEKELINRINEIEAAFKEAFPDVIWLFFEPDDKD